MTIEAAILKDLSAGQSTADSLAPRVKLRTEAAEAILARLVREGTLISFPLGGRMANIPVYRLRPQLPPAPPSPLDS